MKKIFVLAALTATFMACNDSNTGDTTVETDTTTTTTTNTTVQYTPAEGDVSYRDGKVVVWRNGDWVVSDDDVTLDNGVVVRKNG